MRKVLIIKAGTLSEHMQMAADNRVSEIVEGVPRSLAHLYSENSLPVIYTEESREPMPSISPSIEERLVAVEEKVTILATP